MSATGLSAFDKTLQESNSWLNLLMDIGSFPDKEFAYGVLTATLHAVRDRIGLENAVHLGAQLPMLLRGVFYAGWRPSTTPARERHLPAFLAHVAADLPRGTQCDVEAGVRAVFETLWRKIDPQEIIKVIGAMPAELKELWTVSGWAD